MEAVGRNDKVSRGGTAQARSLNGVTLHTRAPLRSLRGVETNPPPLAWCRAQKKPLVLVQMRDSV